MAREVARTYLPQLVSRLGITGVSAEARRCIESRPDPLRREPGECAAAIRRRGATARQLIEAAARAATDPRSGAMPRTYRRITTSHQDI